MHLNQVRNIFQLITTISLFIQNVPLSGVQIYYHEQISRMQCIQIRMMILVDHGALIIYLPEIIIARAHIPLDALEVVL